LFLAVFNLSASLLDLFETLLHAQKVYHARPFFLFGTPALLAFVLLQHSFFDMVFAIEDLPGNSVHVLMLL
jgi:hypothetical protein